MLNPDAVFWSRLKNGDARALGVLYDKYVDKLFAVAMHTVENRELAKDAVQEVFIEIWNYRLSISDIQYSQSYLVKVLRSILYKKIKKENQLHHFQLEDTFISPEENIENILISTDADREQKTNLKNALTKLSSRQKQVLQMHYDEGLSYEQIAQKLNIRYQSVNNLAFRSILRLRDLMFACCIVYFL